MAVAQLARGAVPARRAGTAGPHLTASRGRFLGHGHATAAARRRALRAYTGSSRVLLQEIATRRVRIYQATPQTGRQQQRHASPPMFHHAGSPWV